MTVARTAVHASLFTPLHDLAIISPALPLEFPSSSSATTRNSVTTALFSCPHCWYKLTVDRELPNDVQGFVVTKWNTLDPLSLFRSASSQFAFIVLAHCHCHGCTVHPIGLSLSPLTLLSVSPAPHVDKLNDLLTRLHFSIDHHTVVTISDTFIQDATGSANSRTMFGYL